MNSRHNKAFYVHDTVHLSNTSHINTKEMQFFFLFYLVLELYMFRTQFASIIRSIINCSSRHCGCCYSL